MLWRGAEKVPRTPSDNAGMACSQCSKWDACRGRRAIPPIETRKAEKSRKVRHCTSDWLRKLGKRQLHTREGHTVLKRLHQAGAPAIGLSSRAQGFAGWSRFSLESLLSRKTGIGSRGDFRGDVIFTRISCPFALSLQGTFLRKRHWSQKTALITINENIFNLTSYVI